MNKYILDTNLFFNMVAGIGLGDRSKNVMEKITLFAEKIKKEKSGEVFMPPRIVDELLGFFDDKDQVFIKKFLAVITVKSPDTSNISFPASVFYKLIYNIRGRSYRGMTVAEEQIIKACKIDVKEKKTTSKEFQLTTGPIINSFRERYRQATRVGFLDSLADLDLIVLAKEQNGILVSTDEGVIEWGREFGIREMSPKVFGEIVRG